MLTQRFQLYIHPKSVGVWLDMKRYMEEFSRFNTEEYELINTHIPVSWLLRFSTFSRWLRLAPWYFCGVSADVPFLTFSPLKMKMWMKIWMCSCCNPRYQCFGQYCSKEKSLIEADLVGSACRTCTCWKKTSDQWI